MRAKKKKEPAISFMLPLFPYTYNLLVSIGQSNKELRKTIADYKIKDTTDFVGYEGHTCPAAYAIWPANLTAAIRLKGLPRTSNNYAALAHEICHVVLGVMRGVGIRATSGDADEAYAYMTSYITENIYENINKYYD